MKRAMKAVSGLLIICIGACATVGKDFVRIPDDSMVLGTTTIEDIVSRYGTMELKDVQKDNMTLKHGSYSLTKASAGAELIPQKRQTFWFYEGRLVGYSYSNSFPGDSTDFDAELRFQIKEKESTIGDVVRVFGPPHGKSIYPVAGDVDSTVMEYRYFQAKQNPTRFHTKTLQFTTNDQGIVIKTSYTETGDK